MDSQVAEIKSKLDIVEIIGKYLTIKKRGRHYLACCPFHQEKTPSFIISPELQIFKCFGCGKSGDIFTFVQEFERVDFREALEDLAKLAGITLVKSAALSGTEARKKRLLDLNHEVAKFYHYLLTQHPLGQPALDYVVKRGITPATINTFQIGFSPSNSLLITRYLQKKGFTQDEAIASGTFGLSRYHAHQLYDRFQSRLTFPLCDFRDRILGFSGRALPGTDSNLAKYINSPETDLYHKSFTLFGLNHTKEFIKTSKSAVVVEGEFDLISPFQAGFKNFVAIKGTAFTPDQLQLLRRYTDTLILGLDSDFAGNNAAKKSIELADSLEFDLQVLVLGGKFKDPDEAVLADPQHFAACLSQPIPIWDFLINSAVKNFGIDTIKGKKEVLHTVLPFLVKISNSVIKSDYLHKLAAEIGSDVGSIVAEANKLGSPIPASSPPVLPTTPPKIIPNRIDKLEEYLLSLILSAQKPHLLSQKILSRYQFVTHRFAAIIDHLSTIKSYHPAQFTASLPPELQDVYNQLFIQSAGYHFEPLHRRSEIKKVIAQIQEVDIKSQLTNLNQKITQAEASENESSLSELEKQYNLLLTQLSKISTKP